MYLFYIDFIYVCSYTTAIARQTIHHIDRMSKLILWNSSDRFCVAKVLLDQLLLNGNFDMSEASSTSASSSSAATGVAAIADFFRGSSTPFASSMVTAVTSSSTSASTKEVGKKSSAKRKRYPLTSSKVDGSAII